MPTCENCQIVFKLPEQPVEVTSTRVLCASCEREYRAEKAKRLAAKAAGKAPAAAPAPNQSAPTSKPVPASVPIAMAAKSASAPTREATPPRASAPVPAQQALTKAAPSPAPKASSPSTTSKTAPSAAAKAAPRVEASAAAKPVPAAPAAAPKAKPVAKPARGEADVPKKRSKDVERGTELLRQKSNRSLTIVWSIAGVLLVVAGALVFRAKQKEAKDAAEVAARKLEIETFRTKFNAFDITREQDALAAIAYAEGNTSKWKHEDIEADVNNRVAKAKTNIEASQLRAGYFERLTQLEKVVDDPTSDTKALTEARRTIDELLPKADIVGTEFSARLGTARAKVVKSVAIKMHEEAQAAAADPNNAREALQKYASAEEEIKPLMDDAFHKNNKEDLTFFTGHYKDILKESDALCAALFTQDVIERTPWTDLLAGDQATAWLASSNVSGFEHRIEKGVLEIVGPDAAAGGKQGVMSIGDRELWRDFVLEFEFTLEKGSVDMFLRLPKGTVPDPTIELIQLATQGENAFVAGETYDCELSLIGSTEIYTVHSVEFRPQETALPWTKTRKGSILLAIPTGTAIKFTKFRIRELR